MRSYEVWLATGVWTTMCCLALPMEMKKDAPPASLYRVSGTKGYEFEYKIMDSEAEWVHSRDEWSDGESTRGSYTVKLPDGRIQKVTFIADDDGYHPIITYEPDHWDEEGKGAGGFGAGYDWIGASRGNWYNFPRIHVFPSDSKKTEHLVRGSGVRGGVVIQSPPHVPWKLTSQHQILEPSVQLYDEHYRHWDHPYSFEYYYETLPPQPSTPALNDPHKHQYKVPTSLPVTPDSRELDNQDDLKKKHKIKYEVEESSEEKGDNDDDGMYRYSKVRKFKPRTDIYVKEKPKTFLVDGRKRINKGESEYFEEAYEYVDNRGKIISQAKDFSSEVRKSNKNMMGKMDGCEIKEEMGDDDEMKFEVSREVDSDEEEVRKTDTKRYRKIHRMSDHRKDMDEYLRKIKRVMARFEKPRSSLYQHQALYRQDTEKMVTPRKWTPKKTGDAALSEEQSNEYEDSKEELGQIDVKMTPPDKPFYKPGKMNVRMTPPDKPFQKSSQKGAEKSPPSKGLHEPEKMSIKMTPPDKPFYIPRHRSPPAPPPSRPPTPLNVPPLPSPIRKHTLQNNGGLQDPVLNTSAPMLHAPPPPTFPRLLIKSHPHRPLHSSFVSPSSSL